MGWPLSQFLHDSMSKPRGQRRQEVKTLGDTGAKAEQPCSADTSGYNGEDASQPWRWWPDAGTHLPGWTGMAVVGSEWREREKSINMYLKNAHPVQCVWESIFGSEEGEKVIKNL